MRWEHYGPLVLVVSALVACTAAPPASRAGTARESHGLVLQLADAEVWAWSTRVEGDAVGREPLQHCSVWVNGTVQPAHAAGAHFVADVALDEGENQVRARCSSARGDLRSETDRLTLRLSATPVARARALITREGVLLDGSASRPNEHSRAAIRDYTWYLAGALGAAATTKVASGARVALARAAGTEDRVYELHVLDAHGRSDSARVEVSLRDGALTVPASSSARPSWLARTILYGVVPPLFGEPALQAVTARLDALAELGVTALWLSPIVAAAEGDYGYAVTDYFEVREDFGTEHDLRVLVSHAHALGLRVLLYAVPNHTSVEHPYYVQAAALGPRSHYDAFYARGPRGRVTHYFDWEHLANLDYGNDEVDRFMIATSEHWVRHFGIDGYRVDAAWGVVARDRALFPRWIDALRRARPDALLIAEASARDPYYAEHGFDAAYDWTEQLGHWAWEHVFDPEPGIARRLHAAVVESGRNAPVERALRFLNNNDTGARFITRHGEPMTRVATAALLTLPGLPCLFSFDELGAEYEPYAVTEPLTVPDDEALRAWHARLIALRRARPALHGAGFLPLYVGEHDEVYVFLRAPEPLAWSDAGISFGGDVALVALNFGARPSSVRVALPLAAAQARAPTLRDALGGGTVALEHDGVQLELPAFGAQVLELQ